MPGIRFEVTVDGEKQLDRALSRFGDHLGDMRPFFQKASEMISSAVEEQFETEGSRTSGWAPLSPRYAAWKMAQVGNQPILVFTGRMKKSLIGEGPDSIREADRDQLRWGTSVPYAIFHQRGTSRMPQRRIIDLTEQDRQDLMKALQRFMVGSKEEFGI